jgi:hypothetical protein
MLKPDSFLYPTPTTDFFEGLRNSYKEIKGAYNYLGRLNCEKVLEEIRNSNGIVIEEHSKGTSKSKFIMRVNKDKIQQLCRENHRDRPQKEIDLDCIINDVANEDREKRLKEDKKRLKDELIRQRRLPGRSAQRAFGHQAGDPAGQREDKERLHDERHHRSGGLG